LRRVTIIVSWELAYAVRSIEHRVYIDDGNPKSVATVMNIIVRNEGNRYPKFRSEERY